MDHSTGRWRNEHDGAKRISKGQDGAGGAGVRTRGSRETSRTKAGSRDACRVIGLKEHAGAGVPRRSPVSRSSGQTEDSV
jgi:hypothetical protein